MTTANMNGYVSQCRALIDAKDAFYAACTAAQYTKDDCTIAAAMANVQACRRVLRENYPGFVDADAYECFSRA